jgi:starch phosphorylase
VEALVSLGELGDADVAVELMHGSVGGNDEIADAEVVTMQLADPGDVPGQYRYTGRFPCEQAGRYGFTVRVVPAHPDLARSVDLGCIAWA